MRISDWSSDVCSSDLVARGILAMQVIEQAAAAVDHLQQTTTAVVVVLVGLEVLGQVHDAGGEQGDLDFRRAGVVVAALVFVDDGAGIDGHLVSASGYMRGLQERDETGRASCWE